MPRTLANRSHPHDSGSGSKGLDAEQREEGQGTKNLGQFQRRHSHKLYTFASCENLSLYLLPLTLPPTEILILTRTNFVRTLALLRKRSTIQGLRGKHSEHFLRGGGTGMSQAIDWSAPWIERAAPSSSISSQTTSPGREWRDRKSQALETAQTPRAMKSRDPTWIGQQCFKLFASLLTPCSSCGAGVCVEGGGAVAEAGGCLHPHIHFTHTMGGMLGRSFPAISAGADSLRAKLA